MNRVLEKPALFLAAMTRLLAPGGLAPHVEPLFDARLPLPLPPPRAPGVPPFVRLMSVVPDPYAQEIAAAYAVMTGFALRFWPEMCGVVDAEPFFEWWMHTDLLHRYYRDHLAHQLQVMAIGDAILDEPIDGDTILNRAAAAIAPRLAGVTAHPAEFVRLAWWTAALFHDCMYPYQHFQELWRNIGGACHLPLANPTHAVWFEAHRDLAELVGPITAVDLARCQEAHHQFTGAAELAAQNAAYERDLPAVEDAAIRDRRRTLFSLAAEAILTHHCRRNPRERVGFDKCPLGFLLVLSDELHEAGRPHAESRVDAAGSRAIIRFPAGEIERVRLETDALSPPNLTIWYEYQRGSRHIAGRPKRDWQRHKQSTFDHMLECGPGQLFRRIRVRLRAV